MFVYLCALLVTGMLGCASAKNVHNDSNFDAILARAAHGTLEVKYIQHLKYLKYLQQVKY
jgi:hypothetical protein